MAVARRSHALACMTGHVAATLTQPFSVDVVLARGVHGRFLRTIHGVTDPLADAAALGLAGRVVDAVSRLADHLLRLARDLARHLLHLTDRKSTRLNSSH